MAVKGFTYDICMQSRRKLIQLWVETPKDAMWHDWTGVIGDQPERKDILRRIKTFTDLGIACLRDERRAHA